MDEKLTEPDEIVRRLSAHAEWLVVRENGDSSAVNANEIEIGLRHGRMLFGFLDDRGFRLFRMQSCRAGDNELAFDVTAQFGRTREIIRLVPRTSAAELARHLEIARLERAAEIAAAIDRNYDQVKLIRVALNAENGRLAEIILEEKGGDRIAVFADVTESLTAETLLATALLRVDRFRMRSKKRIAQLWLAGPKKQARALQKLVALLRSGARSDIRVLLLDQTKDAACIELKNLRLTDLWREKPKKLMLPDVIEITDTARRIVAISPDNIDVINSKQGETVRFRGLACARVRNLLGREKAWFGVDRERRPLTEDTRADLAALIHSLGKYRRADTEYRRHRYFITSPESWLESILRRNIKLLDANLILSPLYNQFRTSNDKIDLLALRRDGRLVIIELKTSPDREMIFQAADYWRKIEMRRRRGNLAKARVFGELEILDKPSLVYCVAPALSFHRDFEYFARKLAPEIELWRFELHEKWREGIKVIARKNYSE